jgi:hypothetical protein
MTVRTVLEWIGIVTIFTSHTLAIQEHLFTGFGAQIHEQKAHKKKPNLPAILLGVDQLGICEVWKTVPGRTFDGIFH